MGSRGRGGAVWLTTRLFMSLSKSTTGPLVDSLKDDEPQSPMRNLLLKKKWRFA